MHLVEEDSYNRHGSRYSNSCGWNDKVIGNSNFLMRKFYVPGNLIIKAVVRISALSAFHTLTRSLSGLGVLKAEPILWLEENIVKPLLLSVCFRLPVVLPAYLRRK